MHETRTKDDEVEGTVLSEVGWNEIRERYSKIG